MCETMHWVVYMLRCADGSLYTGITKDIERRVNEHNQCAQKGAKYTRARRPVTLVYQEPQQDRISASQREHAIKRLSRTQKLSLVDKP